MKRLCLVCCLLVVLAPVPTFAGTPPAGTISFMVGEVFVLAPDGEDRPGDFDMEILPGETVRTGHDSTCEITLADESVVRLDEDSAQTIEKAEMKDGSRNVSVFSRAGRAWVNVRKALEKNDEFQVSTDKAVCAVRGTTFLADTNRATTSFSVVEGKVAAWAVPEAEAPGAVKKPSHSLAPKPIAGPRPVTMEKWVEIVSAMQRITIDRRGRYIMMDLEPEVLKQDPFIQWNKKRDQSLTR